MVGESEKEIFSKGSKVEVSSDEDGFKGAWFVATIVDSFPKSKPSLRKKHQNQQQNDAILVEYLTLVADEDRTKPLKEYVQASFVRPLPPSKETEDVSFELNEVVDAFYRDGWWTGVITGVVDNSRFRVFFQNPPEEVEFGRSELRVHQEWVDGKWIRPEKQRTTGFTFSTGAAVEVNLGRRDVWLPATVCKEIGSNSFLVDYQSSRNGDEVSILKATVDSCHIRPRPPDLGDKNFELLEKVDAFFDFSWWAGIITKVLAGRRYTVFFKHINKDMELSHSELRAHMEWTDGKWLNGSKEVIMTSTHQEQVEQACNNSNNTEMDVLLETSGTAKSSAEDKITSSTNSRKNQRESLSPCNEKSPSSTATLSKKKIKHTDHYSDATLSQPSRKLKEENAAEVVLSLAAVSQSRMMPIETSTKEALSGPSTRTMGGTRTNGTGQAVAGDQLSANTKSRVSRKKVETEQHRVSVLVNQETDPVKRKGGRARKSLIQSPQISALDGNAVEVEVLGVMGLEFEEVKSSQAKDSGHHPNEESPKLMRDQPARGKSMELKQWSEVGVKTQVKRRGRPRKLVIESFSVAGEEHNGAGGDANEMVVPDSTSNEVELPASTVVESTGMRFIKGQKKLLNNLGKQENTVSNILRMPLARKEKLPNETVVQVLGKPLASRSSKRRRKGSMSINDELPTQDSQDAPRVKTAEVTGTIGTEKDIDMAVAEISNADDDRPLSKWFEGMHSPTSVDDSRLSPSRIVKARERQDGSAMQPCAIDATGDNMLNVDKVLPFVKTSPIWKTIESLEVYHMTPQKPHFNPLKKCKEVCREGLAIGSMVTFANLVENISKLQFDDPRSILDSNLETLLELEMHGFDVGAVRSRLNELISIKDRQGKLSDQSKEVETQILEHAQEITRMDEEINEIDKKIRDLQEQRALTVSTKESKDSEIAALKSNMDATNESIHSARFDFERLVAAPW